MMKRILTLAVVVVVAVWVAERWNVWFGKHPEPEFVMTESVCCVQLTVGDEPLTERVVSWRSRPDSALMREGAVRLVWIDADGDTLLPEVNKRWIASGGGEAIYYWSEVEVEEGEHRYAIEVMGNAQCTMHNAQLDRPLRPTGTSPNLGEDSLGNAQCTMHNAQFSTPYYSTVVDYSDSIEIVVLGDVQDKRYNPATDSAVVQVMEEYDADFVLQLGDLIHRPHQAMWDVYFRSFEEMCTAVPMVAIVGNHDYHKGVNKHVDERFFYTFPYFLDEQGDAPEVGCCELDFRGAVVWVLDSNQPLWRQMGQRRWLKERLDNAQCTMHNAQLDRPLQFGDGRRKIVALHHPLRSARSVFNSLIVRALYEPMVKEYGVELVLSGHEHTYYRLTEAETGGYEQVITNFSSKNYDDARGEKGREVVELRIEN